MATVNKDFRVKNGLVVESGSITTPLTTAGIVLTNGSGVLSSTATIANSYLANSAITFGSTSQALGSTITDIAGVTINNTTIPTSATLLTGSDIGSSVQGYDADLASIAALSGSNGFLKKTSTNTWSIDTNSYLTTSGAAASVANALVIKADTGTTEGTDLYTFTGSSAKTLDIKAGSNITISKSAGAWTINGSASGVTSVGLSLPSIFTVSNSPVTTTGTLTATLASQTQNYVFAAPSTGGAGAPTFRALVSSDIPTLNQNTTGSAGSVVNALSLGSTLAFTSGTTFDGSAARTLGLASGVVSTGTYTKVTVDTYGRVTAGTTLSSSDIPDISSTYLTTSSASSTYLTQSSASTTYAPKASPTFTGTITTPLTTAGIVLTNGSGVLSSTATIADSYLATISTSGKVANSATTATNNNTASAIVARDASGNFSANMITLAGTTTNATDVATKSYVDNMAAGFNAHAAAEAATTTDLTTLGTWGTVTYTAGSTGGDGGTGVGATLTPANNGALVIDNVNIDANDRVLVKNQTDAKQNGIYIVTAAGGAGSKWTLTRATDYDNNVSGMVAAGDMLLVSAPSSEYSVTPSNQNTTWAMNAQGTDTNQSIKIGTDNIVWVQTSGAGTVTAGTGITVTGNQVAVDTAVVLTQTNTLTGITNKTFVAPVLGAATATSINKVAFTAPTTSATLSLADGSTLATSGSNSITLTSSGSTNVTLPTSGTLATLAGAESLTNKKLGSLTSNGLVTTSGGDGTLSVTTMGTGIATFLSTPTSANLAAALTNETGTGTVVFSDSATLTGTPVAPTASFGTNSTQLATTAYADAAAAGNGTTTPNVAAINFNGIAKDVAGAASITGNTSTVITGVSFATGTYSSAEYLVKTNYGTDSEISKVLVTINYPSAGAQPNAYITEYGNVQSNTTLSTITATVTGSTSNWTVNLQVTPTASTGTTTVKVSGTLLAS